MGEADVVIPPPELEMEFTPVMNTPVVSVAKYDAEVRSSTENQWASKLMTNHVDSYRAHLWLCCYDR